MSKLGRIGPLTLAAIGMLLVFAGVDGAASLTKYRDGETVSKLIQNLQRVHPAFRGVIVGFLLYLIGHLELGWPL